MKIYRTSSGHIVEQDGVLRRVVGDLFDGWQPGEPISARLDSLTLLAPVLPSKIVAVALNYRAHAAEHILGVTCVNDVTARELQKRVGHYTRPKGFDSFAPVGPCVACGLDWSNLRVRGWVNGTLRQDSSTADLIFPVPDLVAF